MEQTGDIIFSAQRCNQCVCSFCIVPVSYTHLDVSKRQGARSQSASGTGPCAPSIAVALEEYFAELSLDAKEAGDLFRFPASFVLVINIQNAFDLTQVGFWDCIYRVKSQDDFTSTVNLTVNGHSPFMCRYNLSNQNKTQPMSKI